MTFKPKYATYLIFPIALSFLFVGTQRNGNMMFFLVSGGLLLSFLIPDNWIKAFYLWSLALGLIGYSVLVFKANQTLYALHMSSTDSLVKLSVAMIVYSVASRIRDNEFETVFNVICVFILIECFIYGLQFFGFNLLIFVAPYLGYTINPGQGAATLGNINFFALCLAITMPLFFRKYWAWCLLFIIPILISARTSGAMIAAAGAFIFWSWKTKIFPKWIVISAVAVVLAVFFLWFDRFKPDDFRVTAWTAIISDWRHWLLIGNGMGSFPILIKVEHAHNDFLEACFEGGLPYMFCIAGFMFFFVRRALRKAKRDELLIISGLIALGISAVFHYPLHLAPSGFISLMLLGMYTSGGKNGRLSDIC